MSELPEWLTVRQTAERLAVSEETVRRMIRNFELPASRKHSGTRAPWLVNSTALQRQLSADAERVAIRQRLAGSGGGYGPEGRAAALDAAAAQFGWTEDERNAEAARLHDSAEREDLVVRLQREIHEDPAIRQKFEQLDDDERFEAEARELAARVRRAERLRERALEIIEEEDEEG